MRAGPRIHGGGGRGDAIQSSDGIGGIVDISQGLKLSAVGSNRDLATEAQCAKQSRIKLVQVRRALKQNIGGILTLSRYPVVGHGAPILKKHRSVHPGSGPGQQFPWPTLLFGSFPEDIEMGVPPAWQHRWRVV